MLRSTSVVMTTTGRVAVDGVVAGEQPDPVGAVPGDQVVVLLVGQRLDRRGVEALAALLAAPGARRTRRPPSCRPRSARRPAPRCPRSSASQASRWNGRRASNGRAPDARTPSRRRAGRAPRSARRRAAAYRSAGLLICTRLLTARSSRAHGRRSVWCTACRLMPSRRPDRTPGTTSCSRASAAASRRSCSTSTAPSPRSRTRWSGSSPPPPTAGSPSTRSWPRRWPTGW